MKYINANNIEKDKIISILKNNICLVGIFSNDCIHCKMLKPEWNKLKTKKTYNKYLVLELNSNVLSNLNIELLSNNFNGYPSILLINNGKFVKEYNNERTFNSIHKFCINYINKITKTAKSTKSSKSSKCTKSNKRYKINKK